MSVQTQNAQASTAQSVDCGRAALKSSSPIDWSVAENLIAYPDAVSHMEDRAAAIFSEDVREQVWLLEHPPLYTAGTSAKPGDLIAPDRFPVFKSGRGGEYTYHGPGQRVAYLMLDLRKRGRDIRCFVSGVEQVVIDTLAEFGVRGERREGRVGVWVVRDDGREEKIGAIGVRIRRWISFHGLSINVDPDLDHFSGIVPCGISEHGVTSLKALGVDAGMKDVDAVLRRAVNSIFGPTE